MVHMGCGAPTLRLQWKNSLNIIKSSTYRRSKCYCPWGNKSNREKLNEVWRFLSIRYREAKVQLRHVWSRHKNHIKRPIFYFIFFSKIFRRYVRKFTKNLQMTHRASMRFILCYISMHVNEVHVLCIIKRTCQVRVNIGRRRSLRERRFSAVLVRNNNFRI